MIRRPPRSTRVRSSAASDVYKRQDIHCRNRRHECDGGITVEDWGCSRMLRNTRRREKRRQKYGLDADDVGRTVPDSTDQLDDVDTALTPASQRLIDHDDDDDQQLDHIAASSSHARAAERPRDAPVVWSDHLLPPPPPRPSRCLLAATSRREFMETSF